jgi:hypothetical protein
MNRTIRQYDASKISLDMRLERAVGASATLPWQASSDRPGIQASTVAASRSAFQCAGKDQEGCRFPALGKPYSASSFQAALEDQQGVPF